MKLTEIANFLKTSFLSYTFTEKGLKYLSLVTNRGENYLDLNNFERKNTIDKLLLSETSKFLKTGRHELPLDLSDFTNFQQEVFQVVSEIKPGKILTYKDVAVLLGKPGGAQAVGSAISKNPVAYFLPTHRVLPQKGIGICRTGAGHLREKLLEREGHDLSRLRGNYICPRKKCCLE